MLYSIHSVGAMILSTPELEMTKEESAKLSDAFKQVADYYPTGMSEKAVAWTNLLMVAGAVYGPRVVTIKMRWSQDSKQPQTGPRTAGPQPVPRQKANGAPAPPVDMTQISPSQIYRSAPIDTLL